MAIRAQNGVSVDLVRDRTKLGVAAMFAFNPGVIELAEIEKDEFLHRLRDVKQIRLGNSGRFVVYPNGSDDLIQNREVHRMINGDFSGRCFIRRATKDSIRLAKLRRESFVPKNPGEIEMYELTFGVGCRRLVFDYLRNNSIEVIERHIAAYLALLWMAGEKRNREAMEVDVHWRFLDEAKRIASKWHGKWSATVDAIGDDGDRIPGYSQRMREIAEEIFVENCGSTYPGWVFSSIERSWHWKTPVPIDHSDATGGNLWTGPTGCRDSSPWFDPIHDDFGFGYGLGFEFHIIEAKFRDDDWEELVVKGNPSSDEMIRAESCPNTWGAWKESLSDSSPFATSLESGIAYLIRNEESKSVKIGWTSSDSAVGRLQSLQTGCDAPLRLVGSFPASSRQTESVLHEIFKRQRKTGEWFALSEQQVASVLDADWRRSRGIH